MKDNFTSGVVFPLVIIAAVTTPIQYILYKEFNSLLFLLPCFVASVAAVFLLAILIYSASKSTCSLSFCPLPFYKFKCLSSKRRKNYWLCLQTDGYNNYLNVSHHSNVKPQLIKTPEQYAAHRINWQLKEWHVTIDQVTPYI